MALGDGIRRDIRTVSIHERERFRSALMALQGTRPPALRRGGTGTGHWLSLHELREAAGALRGPAFLPGHRELCNQFEQLLRDIDPELSLHYWDWNEDPHELFTPTFMTAAADLPFDGVVYGARWPPEDTEILQAATYEQMRVLLERKHDAAHFVYFGGTVVNAHISFHDPFALLLHSNVDRLYALWQAQPGHAWRLDPGQVYGTEGRLLATVPVAARPEPPSSRPWAVDGGTSPKTCVHASVVAPPCYDALPKRVVIDEAANPGRVINFNDVYAGKTFARAASFKITGCGNLTFRVTRGPTGPYKVVTPGGAVTVSHTNDLYQEARIWFGFTGGAPYTAAPAGSVTIRCSETNQDFVFTLQANTVPLPKVGVVLTLDEGAGVADPARCSSWSGVTWTWTWRPA